MGISEVLLCPIAHIVFRKYNGKLEELKCNSVSTPGA